MPENESAPQQETILVVDDEPFIRELIQRTLEPHNFKVLQAENGRIGLEMAQKLNPDLVILDWMMPEMQGLEVCKRLKDNPETQEMPIIMLTAKAEIEDKLHGLKTGADDYINKPFDRRELTLRVEKLLRRKKRERYLNPLVKVLGDNFTEEGIKTLGHELNVARDIQREMVPNTFPKLDEVEIFGKMEPAHVVGGDFFDIIPISDTRYGIVVGDVSGKGIGAALLMVMTRSILRMLAYDKKDPAESLLKLSDTLFRDTPARTFVTVLFGMVDIEDDGSCSFSYASAGHESPILVRSGGEVKWLDKFGMAAGIFDDNQGYPMETVKMNPGDTLLIYTDGVTTARKSVSEFFAEDGIERFLTENIESEPKKIVLDLFEEVKNFHDMKFTPDDTTVVVIRAREKAPSLSRRAEEGKLEAVAENLA